MVEGAPHTAKERSRRSTCVSWGVPAPVYKGARGRGRAKGSPTPTGSRTPSFLVGVGEGERGGEEEGKGGCAPCPIRTRGGGAGLLPFGLSPLFPYGPIRPIYSPANSRNSPILRKNTRTTRNLSDVRI